MMINPGNAYVTTSRISKVASKPYMSATEGIRHWLQHVGLLSGKPLVVATNKVYGLLMKHRVVSFNKLNLDKELMQIKPSGTLHDSYDHGQALAKFVRGLSDHIDRQCKAAGVRRLKYDQVRRIPKDIEGLDWVSDKFVRMLEQWSYDWSDLPSTVKFKAFQRVTLCLLQQCELFEGLVPLMLERYPTVVQLRAQLATVIDESIRETYKPGDLEAGNPREGWKYTLWDMIENPEGSDGIPRDMLLTDSQLREVAVEMMVEDATATAGRAIKQIMDACLVPSLGAIATLDEEGNVVYKHHPESLESMKQLIKVGLATSLPSATAKLASSRS
jgi:hypothetical protein